MINKDNWFVLLFPLPGLFFMFLGHMGYLHEMDAVEWPSVPGTIHTVEVMQDVGDDGDYKYHVEWEYSYEVDGKTYTNSRFSPSGEGDSFDREIDALNQAENFGKGRHETVYYNPENPGEAYLLNKTESSTGQCIFWFGVIYTITAVIIGPFVMFVMWKQNRRKKIKKDGGI